ncbi:uncharacterized protein LOC119996304 [Tripterygium wilfordii]|uniref:uncharacterized protein LOC119996304 n=1 Tax=Tripterygium wilfordii TaxID=458696 RepID=UPI0018F7F7EA|nr:uncharacterized protein LOC119996304 [Tripterygium wilfordii]
MSGDQSSGDNVTTSGRGRHRRRLVRIGGNRVTESQESPHNTTSSPSSVNSVLPPIMSPPQHYREMWVPGSSSPLFPMVPNTTHLPNTPPAPTSNIPMMDTQAAGPSSSQQIPSTNAEANKTWIRPYSNSAFEPYDVHRKMTSIIKSKFEHVAYTWKSVPKSAKDFYFQQFENQFRWDPTDDDAVKKLWNKKNGEILRKIMQRVRKKEDDGEWIQEEAKAALEKLWMEPDYVRKREKAKINRASETGGCTNTGGSIPHSEHKKRLEKELGRPPTKAELFRHCHIKKATQEFVERRAATTYDDYNKLKEARSSQASTSGESPLEPQDDDSIFMEATKYVNKKGRIYGLGSEASHVRFSSSYSRPTRSRPDYLQQEIEERVARMSSELHDQFSSQSTTISTLQEELQFYKQSSETQSEKMKRQNRRLEKQNRMIQKQNQMMQGLFARLGMQPPSDDIDDNSEDGGHTSDEE